MGEGSGAREQYEARRHVTHGTEHFLMKFNQVHSRTFVILATRRGRLEDQEFKASFS